MKRNKILCKSLKTVETLGSVSVICFDKTGTLTKVGPVVGGFCRRMLTHEQNQMAITTCLVGRDSMTATAAAGIIQLSRASPIPERPVIGLSQLALAGGLCNSGEFDASTAHLPLEKRKIFGDATDQAVLRFAESLSSVSEMRARWKTIYRVAFNSKNKFMIHVIQPVNPAGVGEAFETKDLPLEKMILTIKGAPDILLPRCTHFLSSEGILQSLTTEHRKFIEEIKDTWSREAKRVILLARKDLQEEASTYTQSREFENEIMEQAAANLQLIGLVGIVDPPREETPDVVRTLRGAGIKVHMVTGDFKLTAQAIAADCGIITQSPKHIEDVSALSRPRSPQLSTDFDYLTDKSCITNSLSTRSIVLSGSDMMGLDDDQWDSLCRYDEIVFARTTPEQKLRIVKELQARNETVGSK